MNQARKSKTDEPANVAEELNYVFKAIPRETTGGVTTRAMARRAQDKATANPLAENLGDEQAQTLLKELLTIVPVKQSIPAAQLPTKEVERSNSDKLAKLVSGMRDTSLDVYASLLVSAIAQDMGAFKKEITDMRAQIQAYRRAVRGQQNWMASLSYQWHAVTSLLFRRSKRSAFKFWGNLHIFKE